MFINPFSPSRLSSLLILRSGKCSSIASKQLVRFCECIALCHSVLITNTKGFVLFSASLLLTKLLYHNTFPAIATFYAVKPLFEDHAWFLFLAAIGTLKLVIKFFLAFSTPHKHSATLFITSFCSFLLVMYAKSVISLISIGGFIFHHFSYYELPSHINPVCDFLIHGENALYRSLISYRSSLKKRKLL